MNPDTEMIGRQYIVEHCSARRAKYALRSIIDELDEIDYLDERRIDELAAEFNLYVQALKCDLRRNAEDSELWLSRIYAERLAKGRKQGQASDTDDRPTCPGPRQSSLP